VRAATKKSDVFFLCGCEVLFFVAARALRLDGDEAFQTSLQYLYFCTSKSSTFVLVKQVKRRTPAARAAL
jgi:hypothetical protein